MLPCHTELEYSQVQSHINLEISISIFWEKCDGWMVTYWVTSWTQYLSLEITNPLKKRQRCCDQWCQLLCSTQPFRHVLTWKCVMCSSCTQPVLYKGMHIVQVDSGSDSESESAKQEWGHHSGKPSDSLCMDRPAGACHHYTHLLC
jgi:hypothetical protein